MSNSFQYSSIPPEKNVAAFIESIGMFGNFTGTDKELIVLPDGRIDLFFMHDPSTGFEVVLMGLETEPKQRIVPAGLYAYAVSFTPLGLEYILQTSIADILNSGRKLPDNFWDTTDEHFTNLETFRDYVIVKIEKVLTSNVEERKLRLFELIYASKGELSVAELSNQVNWSSRQINRYFTSQFGLSLKAYCDILRFRNSLAHIAKGKLFPELDFADQSHFIREIKKHSGFLPKDLSKNKDDRFVLLSILKQQ
jgi:AraC-like DNA-binding protein